MSPTERYQQDLNSGAIQRDATQAQTIEAFELLYNQLMEQQTRSWASAFVGSFASLFGKSSSPGVKGLYLWGGVGRGKTYLMDIFYESLPFSQKMRTHFHRFMKRVHAELKTLKDQSDPLEVVADRLAKEAKVLCFDEFFVSDITDAMILANLLDGLFRRGVVLITTSNIPPKELYKDGLQRARFLPAIDLLERFTDVRNVDGGVDYRLRALKQARLYYTPVDDVAKKGLADFFKGLVPDPKSESRNQSIEIEGRDIPVVREADDVVWFDFYALCDGPRSQSDYIEIAREYHAVIVENVPEFKGQNDDQARRFIYMVDEFYDRHVKLIMSAQAPIHTLYKEGRLSFEFERTISRVQEMQSEEYLASEHRA